MGEFFKFFRKFLIKAGSQHNGVAAPLFLLLGLEFERFFSALYFYPPFFDISCFWQESTGLSHKIRVYIPFETTMTFTPFLGVMVNRKQFEYFTIEDNPMRKPNAKLLSDEDAESVIAWIKFNRVALLKHWYQEIGTGTLCFSLKKI